MNIKEIQCTLLLGGKIDNIRIGRALARGVQTFNSYKMERASVEITLCAMRGAADIARIEDKALLLLWCF